MCAAVFRPVCGSDGRTYSKLCNMINIVHVGVPLLMSGPALGGAGPSRPRLQVNLHQDLYLHVLDKPTVDYTLARGPLRRGAQLRAIGLCNLLTVRYVSDQCKILSSQFFASKWYKIQNEITKINAGKFFKVYRRIMRDGDDISLVQLTYYALC